jgi:hypothetical protein
MYYLLRTDGSLKLLDGELINGVICKKSGSFLNRKWIPILATEPRLTPGGYHPGANTEGTVISDDQLPELLGNWLRESGMGAEIEKNLPQVLSGTKEFILKSRFGMFGEWAREYLIEAGPELTKEQFHKAMMRALRHAHVKT